MMDMNYNWVQDYSMEGIEAKLLGEELWKKFYKFGTEMIITKTGRRMFPSLRIEISGMEPSTHYSVCLEFVPASNCRFKYSTGTGWAPAGSEESHNFRCRFVHPDSPSSGSYWMSQPISFGRVKLTNTVVPHSGQVVLSSMHKYQPRILITKAHDPARPPWINTKTIVFPETQFIAVTAYQNEEITKLKIDHNPFAKGFRENGLSRCKRKGQEQTKTEDSKLKEESIDVKKENTGPCDSQIKEEIIDVENEDIELSDSIDENQVSSSSSSSPSPSSKNDTSEERIPKMPLTCFPNFYSRYNYHRYEYPFIPPSFDPRPYYFPPSFSYPYPWNTPYGFPMMSSPIPHYFPPVNKNQTPKKVTDFSIRALTGL